MACDLMIHGALSKYRQKDVEIVMAPLIKISKQNMYKWYRQGIFRLLVLLMFDVNFS